MEVFDINGQIISPLAGKTLYVAGDSIAYGKSSAGGYGKCIADKYGMTLTNEAVDGATPVSYTHLTLPTSDLV